MSHAVRVVLFLVCAAAGVGLALRVVLEDAPLHFHLMFEDVLDPDRPGHVRGVTVSGPELFGKCTLALALLTVAVLLWRSMGRRDRLMGAR